MHISKMRRGSKSFWFTKMAQGWPLGLGPFLSPKHTQAPSQLHLLHCIDESLEVKGAAMLASPNFTMGTCSSSKSFSTWLILSCGKERERET